LIASQHAASSKEAVFSSSEDQIRVGHVAVAGLPIASVKTYIPRITWINHAAAGLFSVLFPSDCRICGLPLLNISRLPVCPECLDAIHPVAGKVCSICGERVLSAYAAHDLDGQLKCPVCRRIEHPFERAVAFGSYDSGLRELIHLLKFNRVRPAASVLGRMLAETLAALEPWVGEGTIPVLPVPLYKGKRRQRGFNQAELIVRAALKVYPQRDRFQLASDVLLRTRETHSQIGLSSHQRRENLRGAFRVARAGKVIGREVVLVDDVYTTGTTASECARVLRRAGASKVWVATVARTLKLASNQEAGFKLSKLQGFQEQTESEETLAS
jgi:ComF family protein